MTFEIVENKNKEETHLHTKKIWLAGDANVISRSSVDQKGDLKAKAMNVAAKAKKEWRGCKLQEKHAAVIVCDRATGHVY